MNNYTNYKDTNISWVGKIPKEWKFIRGKYLFNRVKEINKNLECTNLLSLTYNGVLNKKYDGSEGLRPENYNTFQKFNKDDLVFKMIDLANVKTSRVGIVHEYGIMSSAYIRYEPIKEKIIPKFAYWFYYDLYKKEIYNSIGSGVRSTLSSDDLSEISLPIPEISEQELISNYLDKTTDIIDLLIEKTRDKIQLIKDHYLSLVNDYVTKGKNLNVEMKDSGLDFIGKIPKNWQKIKIKHLLSTKITDGPHETPTFVDQGVPFLSVEGIENGKINFQKIRGKISKEIDKIYSKKCKPQLDDVLLVKSGSTTGKSAIVKTKMDFNIWSPLCILRSDTNKIVPDFLFKSIQSDYFRNQVEFEWSYGTQPNIGMNVIENLWIIVPPISEQIFLSTHLNKFTLDYDEKIRKCFKQIKLLNEYRISLISSVITGKKRITKNMI